MTWALGSAAPVPGTGYAKRFICIVTWCLLNVRDHGNPLEALIKDKGSPPSQGALLVPFEMLSMSKVPRIETYKKHPLTVQLYKLPLYLFSL